MKYIHILILTFVCFGCTHTTEISLNESMVKFSDFPSNDSLMFVTRSDEILDEPAKILFNGNTLIIKTFCRGKDKHLVVYSLAENKIINELIEYGDGPEAMLSCEIGFLDDKLWLYDMSKMNIGLVSIDSLLLAHPNIDRYKLNSHYYYRTAMLNDSIMLGTNDMSSKSKIAYVNLKTGVVAGRGDYAYLNENINLGTLIDACSCYVDINPKTKDIVLAYRYTDVIEIYNCKGELKYSLHGPECFDIKFRSNGVSMVKTKDTRKAYVNSYVTEKNIYLLYSGCKKNEANWANGTELYVFSWEGQPQKKYILDQPIYTFAVDEDRGVIYSYSIQKDELVKAYI